MIVVGVTVTIVIWLLALVPPFLLRTFLPDTWVPKLGASGDMFGAGSALFNGLGFFAVVLVLYFDLRERREDLRSRAAEATERKQSRRPFLVPTVVPEGVSVTRALKPSSGTAEAKVIISLKVENVSPEPAMNIGLASFDTEDDISAHAELDDTPFGSGSSAERDAEVTFALSGQAAEVWLRRLAEGQPIRVRLRLEYDSINDTRWASGVAYELRSKDLEARRDLQRVLDGDEAAFIGHGQGFDEPAYLSFKVIAGSWDYEVVQPTDAARPAGPDDPGATNGSETSQPRRARSGRRR